MVLLVVSPSATSDVRDWAAHNVPALAQGAGRLVVPGLVLLLLLAAYEVAWRLCVRLEKWPAESAARD